MNYRREFSNFTFSGMRWRAPRANRAYRTPHRASHRAPHRAHMAYVLPGHAHRVPRAQRAQRAPHRAHRDPNTGKR